MDYRVCHQGSRELVLGWGESTNRGNQKHILWDKSEMLLREIKSGLYGLKENATNG